MRDSFDKRKAVFIGANLALEQRGKALDGGFGGGQVGAQAVERTVVVLNHLRQAKRQAGEGQFMAGQDQLTGRRIAYESEAAVESFVQRVRVAHGGVDSGFGGNAR